MTHFVRTSGVILLIVEVHTRTFLPLPIPLKNYVHGDLRSNNIMIRTDVMDKSVDLRVIDFDWVGEARQVRYPAERNREIWWPGEAGGPIEQDHDLKMVYSWMDALQQNILFTRFALLESAA